MFAPQHTYLQRWIWQLKALTTHRKALDSYHLAATALMPADHIQGGQSAIVG